MVYSLWRCGANKVFFCSTYENPLRLFFPLSNFLHHFYFSCLLFLSLWLYVFSFCISSSPFLLSSTCFCCTSHVWFPWLHVLQLPLAVRVATFEMIHQSRWCDSWTTFMTVLTQGDSRLATYGRYANSSWWAAYSIAWHSFECSEETLVALVRPQHIRSELLFLQYQ